jgi:DNA-binding FrmR family transcriptional regulator
MLEQNLNPDIVIRLKKVEGQIRGIQKMIENDRSQVEILDQIFAARKAINMIGIILIKSHLAASSLSSKQTDSNKKEIDDFLNSIYRFVN